MKENKIITFTIPETLHDDLVRIIKKENLTINGILKNLISDFLDSFHTVKTGRGNRGNDHKLVMNYLRKIHPNTARKITIANETGIKQDRVLIILNNLSGVRENYKKGIDSNEKDFDFLVYETLDNRHTEYGIYKDLEKGITP